LPVRIADKRTAIAPSLLRRSPCMSCRTGPSKFCCRRPSNGAGSGEFHCEAIRQWICHRAANPRASRGRENGEASWDVVRKGDVSFVKRLGRRKGKGLRVNGGALASVCSIDAMQRQRQPAALVRRERGAI
jgi:hypothetical protein